MSMNARVTALFVALTIGGMIGGSRLAAQDTTARAKKGAVSKTASVADSVIPRADEGRTLGQPTTTLWLIEAGDFECAVCRTWHLETFPTIERDYIRTGKIRFAFVNYPVAQHRFATVAASAAMCAGAQQKFWPMHDSLYAQQAKWIATNDPAGIFRDIARGLKLDMKQWSDCFGNDRAGPLIQSDHDRLRDAGVHGTPSFFIGDRGLPGDPGWPALRAIIDSVLAGRGR
ncbi:MAG TPA: thioredoxin domain-containing protein [Gemmatimonadaceae bacterium]